VTLLVALPWWISLILAAVAYGALTYGVPHLRLSNPFLQSFALAAPPVGVARHAVSTGAGGRAGAARAGSRLTSKIIKRQNT
jgi:hypothetical protein